MRRRTSSTKVKIIRKSDLWDAQTVEALPEEPSEEDATLGIYDPERARQREIENLKPLGRKYHCHYCGSVDRGHLVGTPPLCPVFIAYFDHEQEKNRERFSRPIRAGVPLSWAIQRYGSLDQIPDVSMYDDDTVRVNYDHPVT